MGDPVIVSAVRTPIGRRDGGLSQLKAVALLRHVQFEVLRRVGVDPGSVDQIIGGCVTQAGEQSLNVTRNAWLNSGMDHDVPATTVDTSCGSSQQASHLAAALIAAGDADCVMSCGVESMSRVPIGVNLTNGPGHYKLKDYPWDDPPKAQFGGAERIAGREGFTRQQLDVYGARSQARAAASWARADFADEITPLIIDRDEGLRHTTLDGLAGLSPTVEGALHTAGTTSQISDGAAALLWMSRQRAETDGLRPRARLAAQVVTGSDPYFLLDGPIAATRKLLSRSSLRLKDVDRYEVNEAFAAVVLAWQRAFDADWQRLNVNGGAISLGHPLGASGVRLLVSALHELERHDKEFALVTMCCGGALGTASLLQRL